MESHCILLHAGTNHAGPASFSHLRCLGRPLPSRLRTRAFPRRGISVTGLGLAASRVFGLGLFHAITAGPLPGKDAQTLVRIVMRKFENGDVEGSLTDFDEALRVKPSIRPYLWQRGLSLYYVGSEEALAEGAHQFRDDVAVNPNDTEEAIWAFLCEAKLKGYEAARNDFLLVGRDSRPVMRAAYEAFRTGSDPSTILEAAGGDTIGHAAFYARLYVALWNEAHGMADDAKSAMLDSLQTRYAQSSGDYMASLANVHARRRGWLDTWE